MSLIKGENSLQRIERVKGLVNRYQPRMEAKSGIPLGQVDVRDYKEAWARMQDFAYHKLIDGQHGLRKIGGYGAYMFTIPFLRAAAAITRMRTEGSTIYVNSGAFNRLVDPEYIKHDDQAAVHELSHVLWNRISGTDLTEVVKDIESVREMHNFSRWAEGFANYCDDVYFADVYPDGYKLMTPKTRWVRSSEKRIAQAVEHYGESVLFQIPTDWERLGREM